VVKSFWDLISAVSATWGLDYLLLIFTIGTLGSLAFTESTVAVLLRICVRRFVDDQAVPGFISRKMFYGGGLGDAIPFRFFVWRSAKE